MKILHRHMLFRLMTTLIFFLMGFFLLLILFDFYGTVADMVNRNASVMLALEYYFLQTPKLAQMVVPISFLFSVLYVLGSSSRNQETLAVQASGVGLHQLCWPFFMVGGLLTLTLLCLNYRLSPEAEMQRRAIHDEISNVPPTVTIFQGVAYANFRDGHVWQMKQIDAEKGTFLHAEILVRDSLGRDQYKLFAAQGTFRDDHWEPRDCEKDRLWYRRFSPGDC